MSKWDRRRYRYGICFGGFPSNDLQPYPSGSYTNNAYLSNKSLVDFVQVIINTN